MWEKGARYNRARKSMEGIRFRIPFEGGVIEWCVVVEVKRRRATIKSKTTTRHDKLEVLVVLYTPTRHTKLEVVVDHIHTTTRHSELEVVFVFTKYSFWSGNYSHVCMDFFKKLIEILLKFYTAKPGK